MRIPARRNLLLGIFKSHRFSSSAIPLARKLLPVQLVKVMLVTGGRWKKSRVEEVKTCSFLPLLFSRERGPIQTEAEQTSSDEQNAKNWINRADEEE
jgi:hypothetical protein